MGKGPLIGRDLKEKGVQCSPARPCTIRRGAKPRLDKVIEGTAGRAALPHPTYNIHQTSSICCLSSPACRINGVISAPGGAAGGDLMRLCFYSEVTPQKTRLAAISRNDTEIPFNPLTHACRETIRVSPVFCLGYY